MKEIIDSIGNKYGDLSYADKLIQHFVNKTSDNGAIVHVMIICHLQIHTLIEYVFSLISCYNPFLRLSMNKSIISCLETFLKNLDFPDVNMNDSKNVSARHIFIIKSIT